MSPSAAAEHIDEDFRSGVCLGMGMCLLVFSMIPSRIVIVGVLIILLAILKLFLPSLRTCSVTEVTVMKRSGYFARQVAGEPTNTPIVITVYPKCPRNEEGREDHCATLF